MNMIIIKIAHFLDLSSFYVMVESEIMLLCFKIYYELNSAVLIYNSTSCIQAHAHTHAHTHIYIYMQSKSMCPPGYHHNAYIAYIAYNCIYITSILLL